MKQLVLLGIACIGLWAGCSSRTQSIAHPPKTSATPPTPVTDLVVYTVRTDLSTIHWSGSSGKTKHTGTLRVKDGRLLFQDKELVSGSFVLDVASLQVTDLAMPEKSYLEGHLKAKDFFETDKHPTATFVIDGVDKILPTQLNTTKTIAHTHHIRGTLTIRGIPHAIAFDAALAQANKRIMVATDEFFISRSAFGIVYGDVTEPNGKVTRKIHDEMGIRIELGAEYIN